MNNFSSLLQLHSANLAYKIRNTAKDLTVPALAANDPSLDRCLLVVALKISKILHGASVARRLAGSAGTFVAAALAPVC